MRVAWRWAMALVLALALGGVFAAAKSALAADEPQLDPRFEFGGFRKPGNWYKGNLHLHSTISDGRLDPVPTVEAYRQLGYDFTALTDHIGGFRDKQTKAFRPLVYPLEQLNKPGFLVIPGIEYDTNRNGETIHYVAVGPGYDARLEEGEDVSHAIQESWDKGAFVFIAHPHWSLDSTQVTEGIAFLPGLEVFNYATWLGEGDRGNSELHWDRLLRLRRRVLGVATDDCHDVTHHAGGGWVMVKAPELTAAAIVGALRDGQYYASSGPVIHDVWFDTESNLRVRCTPAKYVRAFAGVGKVSQAAAKPGEVMLDATIKWNWKSGNSILPFVRVEVTDEQGRTAWSQAAPGPGK